VTFSRHPVRLSCSLAPWPGQLYVRAHRLCQNASGSDPIKLDTCVMIPSLTLRVLTLGRAALSAQNHTNSLR
jgi:hypothetical protein